MAMIHFGGNSYPQCWQLVLEVDHTRNYMKQKSPLLTGYANKGKYGLCNTLAGTF